MVGTTNQLYTEHVYSVLICIIRLIWIIKQSDSEHDALNSKRMNLFQVFKWMTAVSGQFVGYFQSHADTFVISQTEVNPEKMCYHTSDEF